VIRNSLLLSLVLLGILAFAQQNSQPQVKVNVLNVCTPSAADQKEIAAALASIPKKADWSPDFEVDRGRSLLDDNSGILPGSSGNTQVAHQGGTADWVRIRHEFAGQAMFSTVQYSFSADPTNMVETLVFHVRDPKDLLSIAIEDGASAVTTPATMLSTNTPATRVKLERFGKSSIVLARCNGTEDHPAPDQSAYESLFQSATKVMETYRGILGAHNMVPQELARIKGSSAAKSSPAGKAPVKKSDTPQTSK
jgi:hypothetical protein